MSKKWYIRVLFACIAFQLAVMAFLPECNEAAMVNLAVFLVAAGCCALNWIHENRKSAK